MSKNLHNLENKQKIEKTFYSRNDVIKHNNSDDLWLIIDNKVYDVTKYFSIHPGGKQVLLDVAGKDATERFEYVGHSHKAKQRLNEFYIGEVEESEKINVEINFHKGFISEYFPFVGLVLFIAIISFLIHKAEIQNKENVSIEIIPFVLGIFPSLFLIASAYNLWFGHHFRVHRIGGLSFLILYAFSWYYFIMDYDWFKESFLVWLLLANGNMQAISAIIQIGPTLQEKDSGEYFSNKGKTVSKDFIVENWYYQILTAFSSLYYYPKYFNLLRSSYIGLIIEIVFVFLPFLIIRPFFPKTRLRDAISKSKDLTTNDHTLFMAISNWAIKIFVILGKHYIGFYFNALRYLNLFDSDQEKMLQFMMLANAGTVSISTFLHTLKFKNQLTAKISMTIYLMILYTPVIAIYQLSPIFVVQWKLWLIFTIGMIINFTDKIYQAIWTIGLTIFLVAYNNGVLKDLKYLIIS